VTALISIKPIREFHFCSDKRSGRIGLSQRIRRWRYSSSQGLTEIKAAFGRASSILRAMAEARTELPDRIATMTSAPGHKRSRHLIEAEAYRRVMSGELPQTLGEFAHQVLDWFRQTHADASPITLETIENQIRETWHRRHELIRGE
jgi:hypothetical protein